MQPPTNNTRTQLRSQNVMAQLLDVTHRHRDHHDMHAASHAHKTARLCTEPIFNTSLRTTAQHTHRARADVQGHRHAIWHQGGETMADKRTACPAHKNHMCTALGRAAWPSSPQALSMQNLSNRFAHAMARIWICLVIQPRIELPRDTLAEWLRRRPAKPMGSPRVGSNPTGVVSRQPAFVLATAILCGIPCGSLGGSKPNG